MPGGGRDGWNLRRTPRTRIQLLRMNERLTFKELAQLMGIPKNDTVLWRAEAGWETPEHIRKLYAEFFWTKPHILFDRNGVARPLHYEVELRWVRVQK